VSDRRKVLVIATTFPRHDEDDQPRFVLDLCKSLPGNYEQLVLTPSAPGLTADDQVEGISVRRFRYFFNRAETLAYGSGMLANVKANPARWLLVPFLVMGMALAIRKELRRFNPDVVHAHWWFPGGFAARMAIATTKGNYKLLTTCHGADYFVVGQRFPRLRRWVLNGSDAVAMVSPAMRDHAIRQGFSANRLSVASMGVALKEHFKPGAASERHGVLYVGRLVEKKGVGDLIAGWAKASDKVQAQGLSIIGSGQQEESLRALSISLGASDSVNFLGPVTHDELPEYFRKAALLVFPSIVSADNDQEGLGLVAVEAMGCNCPVLASDVHSLADVIIEGQTGFVYPMGDTTAMAQRLDELVSSPERCREVAERGGDAVRARFDWATVGDRYRSLYDDLLGLSGSPPAPKTGPNH
jgi:glycosyltransferase involved in cell wall biosynthesis